MQNRLTKDKFLSDSELQAIKDRIPQYLNRDSLIIELAIETGARASEILSITKSDVNHVNRSVYIRGLKQGNDREIPLRMPVYERLTRYADGCKSDRIFAITYKRLFQIWKRKYTINNKKFHSLRHTFAVNLYKRTRDMKLVQLALGHRSLNNTQIYVDYVLSQEELRRLIL